MVAVDFSWKSRLDDLFGGVGARFLFVSREILYESLINEHASSLKIDFEIDDS